MTILIIGAGMAGLCAAVSAAERRMRVVVLEALEKPGGLTLESEGFLSAVDPRRLRPTGLVDTHERFLEQTFAAGGRRGRRELVESMAFESTSMLYWLETHGVEFDEELFMTGRSFFPRLHLPKKCADVEVQSGEKAYWFRYDENGEIVGGIAKFVQPMKDAVVAALGREKGCFVGLTAGKLLAAQKAAGVLRSKLGAFCPNHMDKECYEFCWIVDFPMYEIGEESGLLEFCHNPFSMPNGGLEILKKAAAGEVDPLSITAFQYDLVCNGVELSSGAVRNHDPEIMIEAFQLVRLGEDDVKAKFPAMYNAFTYGAPPHAGIAPGVDRMVMLLAGEDSIREIIPFPMNKNAQDLMMGAPSFVTQAQLDELNIVCTKKEEDEAAE